MTMSNASCVVCVLLVLLCATQSVLAGCAAKGQTHSKHGETCSASCPCEDGLSCQMIEQKCYHSPRRLGETCMALNPCGPGLSCHPIAQTCYHYPRHVGEPCMAGHGCADGLSCQPGVHRCYHQPRLLGEPCMAGYTCSKMKTDYYNPRTKKYEGESTLQCKSFSQTCALFPPKCPSARQGACEACRNTIGFTCSASSLLIDAIEKIGCGGELQLTSALPKSKRTQYVGTTEEIALSSSLLAAEMGLNFVDNLIPTSLPGQINGLCQLTLLPALNGACTTATVAAPVCMSAVTAASVALCNGIANGVKDLCILATKYVFDATQVADYLRSEKCTDTLCHNCVSDGCFDL
eukprot:GILJ01012384.1.p1 GENE.GILJ01012384.1~~GILJ01012384.1.p1  ORF type:complete len:349 (+),score=12.61 GILJ01012384.1:37-1083(+)